MLDALQKALSKFKFVKLRGCGTFGINYRASCLGRNSKTGEAQVPAKRCGAFQGGKKLKEMVDTSK